MIQEFVQAFEAHKEELREKFRANFPASYGEIVKAVVEILSETEDENFDSPDPERIHEIDDGDYQGTLLYLIPDKGYQTSTYWYVFVSYGSCSGCDTLEAIRDGIGRWDNEAGEYVEEVSEEVLSDLMTEALHVVQGMKKISAY